VAFRGAAGVCLARPRLFADSFTGRTTSAVDFAGSAAAVLELEIARGRLAMMEALEALHKYFVGTAEVREFSETLDFYRVMDILEWRLGEADENAGLALMTLLIKEMDQTRWSDNGRNGSLLALQQLSPSWRHSQDRQREWKRQCHRFTEKLSVVESRADHGE
jgi:hypothetical protein